MHSSGYLMFKTQVKINHLLKRIQNWCLYHRKSHGTNSKVLSDDLASLGKTVSNIKSGNVYL